MERSNLVTKKSSKISSPIFIILIPLILSQLSFTSVLNLESALQTLKMGTVASHLPDYDINTWLGNTESGYFGSMQGCFQTGLESSRQTKSFIKKRGAGLFGNAANVHYREKKGSPEVTQFQSTRLRQTPVDRDLIYREQELKESQDFEVNSNSFTSKKPDSDIVNRNTGDRLFQPEPWPKAALVADFLKNRKSEPTTVVFAKFISRKSRTPVEVRYSVNRHDEEFAFKTTGRLDSLLPLKEGVEVGSSPAEQFEFFLRIFKTCLQQLDGQLWWNGYIILFDQHPKARLKVTGFELDQSQLLFDMSNLRDIEVHRTSHKVTLYGSPEDKSENQQTKSFRIRGSSCKEVKVNKLHSRLLTVHIPEYNPTTLSH